MLLRRLVVVGLVGLASLAINAADAEDVAGPLAVAGIEGVSFIDPAQIEFSTAPQLGVTLDQASEPRFPLFGDTERARSDNNDTQRYEVALVASRGMAGLPVDVSIAQRASIGVNSEGDIARQGRGSEVRLGRGLARRHKGPRSSWDEPAWYFFAASDDEALTWAPGSHQRGRSAGFALQDRIEIGDIQAGVTYEAGPFQASLAYVERKVSARTGSTTIYQDENFAGLTLTMRH